MFLFDWRRRNPIFGLIGFCVALVPLIILGIQAAGATAPFITMQLRALVVCRVYETAQMDGSNLYRKGHVLVVNSLGIPFGQVLANKALEGIVATAPDQVGTLICVGNPVFVQIGTAPSGDKLLRVYRDVCLIE